MKKSEENKQMSVNLRIEYVMKLHNLNPASFSKMLGYESDTLIRNIVSESGRKSKPSFETLSKISDAFPDLNLDWLITGRGDMELPESEASKEISIGRDNNVMNVKGNNSGHNVKMGDNSQFNPADLSNLTEMLKDKDYIIAKLRKMIEEQSDDFIRRLDEKDKKCTELLFEKEKFIQNMMDREQKIVNHSYERNEENQKRMDKKDERIKELQEKLFELIDKAK